MYYYNDSYYSNDYLQHYGVKGMKWGVRRTYARDIYRKGKKVHSKGDPAERSGIGVRTKIYRKKNTDNPDTQTKQKKGLSDKQKKALKVGAAVAGTALAAYGAYKVGKFIKNKNVEIASDRGRDAAERYFDSNYKNIGVTKFKDGSTSIDFTHPNSSGGLYNAGRFANKKDADRVLSYLNEQNKNTLENAKWEYNRHVNAAKNDSIAKATKNVYQHYKKKRK